MENIRSLYEQAWRAERLYQRLVQRAGVGAADAAYRTATRHIPVQIAAFATTSISLRLYGNDPGYARKYRRSAYRQRIAENFFGRLGRTQPPATEFRVGDTGLYWLDDDSPTVYTVVHVEPPFTPGGKVFYRIDRRDDPWGDKEDKWGIAYRPLAREDRLTADLAEWRSVQDDLREEALVYENDLLPDQALDSDPYDIDRDESVSPYEKVLRWMKNELALSPGEYTPIKWTVPCATMLAEAAAHHGIVDECALDDETHFVWDAAVEAVEWYEEQYGG